MNHTFDPSMKVSAEQIQEARENRMTIQMDLIERYRTPIIHFTLNIPGFYKVFGRIPEVFEEGCRIVRSSPWVYFFFLQTCYIIKGYLFIIRRGHPGTAFTKIHHLGITSTAS